MILRPIVADDIAARSPPLPRKPIAIRLGDPTAVRMKEPILTILLVALGAREALNDRRLGGLPRWPLLLLHDVNTVHLALCLIIIAIVGARPFFARLSSAIGVGVDD